MKDWVSGDITAEMALFSFKAGSGTVLKPAPCVRLDLWERISTVLDHLEK